MILSALEAEDAVRRRQTEIMTSIIFSDVLMSVRHQLARCAQQGQALIGQIGKGKDPRLA